LVEPFNGVSQDDGYELITTHLGKLKKEIESYYNATNLVALSPPNAQVGTIPEKPDILICVEQIRSTGHLLMAGGLLNQPHIFMYEFEIASMLKDMLESFGKIQQ
jgi:hypothetical protein